MKKVEIKEEEAPPRMIREDSEHSSELLDEPEELNYVPKSKRKESVLITYRGIFQEGKLPVNHSLTLLYTTICSENWKIMHGQKSGVSQSAAPNAGKIIWNFPFQITLETVRPEGWPQIVVMLEGKDYFGRTVAKGYGNIHLPVSAGTHTRKIRIFQTIPPSSTASCCAFLMGYIHELSQPQNVLLKEGRQYLQTRSLGEITIKVEVRRYQFENQGFE